MNVIVNTECPFCGQLQKINVPKAGYEAWRRGQLIQRALPELSANDREALMTGICPKCFDAL